MVGWQPQLRPPRTDLAARPSRRCDDFPSGANCSYSRHTVQQLESAARLLRLASGAFIVVVVVVVALVAVAAKVRLGTLRQLWMWQPA